MNVVTDLYTHILRPVAPWFLGLLFLYLLTQLPPSRLEDLVKLFFEEIRATGRMFLNSKPSGRGLNAAGLFGLLVYVCSQGHNLPDAILPSVPQPDQSNDMWQVGAEVVVVVTFATALILCLKNTGSEK